MWQALDEICSREGVEFEHLCGRLERTLEGGSLAAALRVYALNFYRRVKL